MEPADIARELTAVEGRGPCTDAERRAGRLLVRRVRGVGRAVRTETHWVRPNWAAVWLMHTVLAIAGTVVSVDAPVVGLALTGVAALSALVELSGRLPALSLLLPRRATQNVISSPPDDARPAVRLVVTAGYDAARALPGLARPLAGLDAALRRGLRGRWPSPLAQLALVFVALAGLAGARLAGAEGTVLGAAQLAPTVVCILAAALLTDAALSEPTPGAGAHASAAGVALALVRALDEAPPRSLAVELVLAGAADGPSLGMRGHVRARRKAVRPEDVAVLHIEPCGAGRPAWWISDGPFALTRLHPHLAGLAATTAQSEGHLKARPHRGHGVTGALAARRAGWPAIAVGALDERGQAPRVARPEDTADAIEPAAMRATLELALALVRALDRDLAQRAAAG